MNFEEIFNLKELHDNFTRQAQKLRRDVRILETKAEIFEECASQIHSILVRCEVEESKKA